MDWFIRFWLFTPLILKSLIFNEHSSYLKEFSILEKDLLGKYEKDFLQYLNNQKKNIEESLENFRFKNALLETMNITRRLNKYLDEKKPWSFSNEDFEPDKIIFFSLQIIGNISILVYPFLPFSSKKIQKMIQLEEYNFFWENIGNLDLVKPNLNICNKEILFTKIEDEEIDNLIFGWWYKILISSKR